jgi:hypothetical protein
MNSNAWHYVIEKFLEWDLTHEQAVEFLSGWEVVGEADMSPEEWELFDDDWDECESQW